VVRKGSVIIPQPIHSFDVAKKLGCEYNSQGGIIVDIFGRKNIQGCMLQAMLLYLLQLN